MKCSRRNSSKKKEWDQSLVPVSIIVDKSGTVGSEEEKKEKKLKFNMTYSADALNEMLYI